MKKNERFGHLVAKIHSHDDIWICTCDCGRQCTCSEKELLSGIKTSCKNMTNGCHADMLNITYGHLKVIDVNKNYGRKVRCKCDLCNREKMIIANDLKNNKIKTCGCTRSRYYLDNAESHIGERHGKLTIIKPVLIGNKYSYYCQCDCGNTTTVQGEKLFSGHTQSCGCLRSKANATLAQILAEANIPFEQEYSFPDLKAKSGKLLRFDFAIFNNDQELIGLVENNGEQHYSTIPRGYYTEEKLKQISFHDWLKQEYCITNNIPLLIIPYQYFEYNDMKAFFFSSNLGFQCLKPND